MPQKSGATRAIVVALETEHERGVDYWSTFSTSEFFRTMGRHWSAAEHVRHLTRSMAPLLPALRLPKLGLRMAFGMPDRPSRAEGQISDAYRAALAAGGQAGRFAPPPDTHAPDQARRDKIMDEHSETLRGLTQAMERWTEAQLDGYRLPHPLLGKLTVREMMLFTLIHNRHHVEVAKRRWAEAGLVHAG
ncbi:MAG: DinB family protein [Gemmatimonadaceae bacterium]|nr:DinB family protein [Gemmatimonadaceae bacterium]